MCVFVVSAVERNSEPKIWGHHEFSSVGRLEWVSLWGLGLCSLQGKAQQKKAPCVCCTKSTTMQCRAVFSTMHLAKKPQMHKTSTTISAEKPSATCIWLTNRKCKRVQRCSAQQSSASYVQRTAHAKRYHKAVHKSLQQQAFKGPQMQKTSTIISAEQYSASCNRRSANAKNKNYEAVQSRLQYFEWPQKQQTEIAPMQHAKVFKIIQLTSRTLWKLQKCSAEQSTASCNGGRTAHSTQRCSTQRSPASRNRRTDCKYNKLQQCSTHRSPASCNWRTAHTRNCSDAARNGLQHYATDERTAIATHDTDSVRTWLFKS